MKRFAKALFAALLIAALLASCALAAGYSAKVLTPSMTVYDSDGNAAGALPQGTSFVVTGAKGNWARVNYKGRTGYAKLNNIIFDNRIKVVVKEATTLSFVTDISYQLNMGFKALLEEGATAYAVGYYGGWLLIENGSGSALGYARADAFVKA